MSKLKGRFLEKDTIDGSLIRLNNAQSLRARNAADSADVSLFELSILDQIQAGATIDMNSNALTNLPPPVNPTDALRKTDLDSALANLSSTSYVDSQVSGLNAEIIMKADQTYVDSAIAPLALKSYVDSQDSALNSEIALKADQTYLDAQIAPLALKSYVDSQDTNLSNEIALKSDKTYVDSQISTLNSEIALKSDQTYVDSQVSTLNSEIALKSDQSYVDGQISTINSKIALKSDQTYMDSQVSTLNSKIALKSDQTYVDSQLSLKASVSQLNAAIQGLAPKQPVRVTSTAALPSNTYSNGVLTASASGVLPAIDGVTLAVSDRILIKDEANSVNNGIYSVTNLGSASTHWVLTRTTDADTGDKLWGAYVFAQAGLTNADHEFLLISQSTPTVGTSPLTFSDFGTSSSYTAGSGITIDKSSISANLGAGLAFNSGAITVQVQGPGSANTTSISGNIVQSLRAVKDTFTLTSTDISNGYVDLTHVAHQSSLQVLPIGGPLQSETDDYMVNYTGGASGVTRVIFRGDLSSNLAPNDVLKISYQTL